MRSRETGCSKRIRFLSPALRRSILHSTEIPASASVHSEASPTKVKSSYVLRKVLPDLHMCLRKPRSGFFTNQITLKVVTLRIGDSAAAVGKLLRVRLRDSLDFVVISFELFLCPYPPQPSACFRSAIRSSASSRPHDRRTSPSRMPRRLLSSGVMP